MFFKIALYCSLTIFLAGSLWRAWKWFSIRIGAEASDFSPGRRLVSAVKGIAGVLFSRRILAFIKTLILDVFLQAGILREDLPRWLAHMGILFGFLLLLLMHALEDTVAQALFPDYVSTRNPFLFLRNLFGAMLLAGVAAALVRRVRTRPPRLFTNAADRWAIAILAVVVISGFLLEGVKITSHSDYKRMEEEYYWEDEELEAYWVEACGLVSPGVKPPFDAEALARGREAHEGSCADCHARPQWAFLGYGASRAIRPAAAGLDRAGIPDILWTIHFLACFIGLAYLPFSKFFHAFSSPLGLLANRVADKTIQGEPANRVTRRALALDACVHCGTCSEHCSVRPVYHAIPNETILPSEKLASVGEAARGGGADPCSLEELSEGSFICTLCRRCTEVCPVGIDLHDLWLASRNDLVARGRPEPNIWVREANTADWAARLAGPDSAPPPESSPESTLVHARQNLADRSESFSACVQCLMCTNVCPVVACSEDPPRDLGLTPQQIMNLLRLGLKEMTLGSTMVWSCATCYMCQEHCPEGIPVADILYELRNLAYTRLGRLKRQEGNRDPGREAAEGGTDQGEPGGPST